MRGGYGKWEFFDRFLVSAGVCGRERDMRGRELTYVAIGRRIRGRLRCLCIYSCLYP